MVKEENIDRESQEKLYVQLYHIVKRKIENGEWPVGKIIPSEDELCKIFDVSKATVRLAIQELVRGGYLKRRQGRGTFVTYSGSHYGITMKTRLTEDMLSKDIPIKKQVFKKEMIKPAGEIRSYFEGENEVFFVSCKGYSDDDPVYMEEFFIPLWLKQEIYNNDFCQTSIYELVQDRSIKKIHKIIQSIEVIEVRGNIAVELKMEVGCHALCVHSILLSSDGSTIAYIKLIGNGKKYKIQTEFEKIK